MRSAYRLAIELVTECTAAEPQVQQWPDGRCVFYPRGARLGFADELPAWKGVSQGTVVALTTVQEHSHPEHQAATPFTLVLVDAKGARMMCRLDPLATLPTIGSTVSLRVEQMDGRYRIIAS